MHEFLISCDPDTPLVEVAQRMTRHRIHCVLVMDSQGEHTRIPWGVVSDLDLAGAALTGLDNLTARDVAGTPLVTIGPQEPALRAAQLMSENACAHLVVVDPESQLPLGIISTLDIARIASGHEPMEPPQKTHTEEQ